MSNNTPVTLEMGNFPNGYCWPGSPQTFANDLLAILSGFLPGQYNTFNYGQNTPSVDDQNKPWIKLDNSGFPIGLYVFAGGAWVRPYRIPPSSAERMIWLGSEADLWAYDGGDGTNPTAVAPTPTTGSFWQRDLTFGDDTGSGNPFRVPVGIGKNPTVYDGGTAKTISVGDTGGEERHLLTDTEQAHQHFIVNSDTNLAHQGGAGNADLSSTQSLNKYITHAGDGSTMFLAAGSTTNPSVGLTSDISTNPTPPTNGRTSHTNMMPYVGVIFAKRTVRAYYTA